MLICPDSPVSQKENGWHSSELPALIFLKCFDFEQLSADSELSIPGQAPGCRCKRTSKGAAVKQQKYNKEKKSSGAGLLAQAVHAPSLQKKSLLFFLLTILLTLVIAAGLFFDATTKRMLPSDAISHSTVLENSSNTVLDRNGGLSFSPVFLTASLILLLGILIGGMYSFQRSVITPLEITSETVRRMTEGHLDVPISLATRDEIGQVAEGINGMAINMQEVLLFIWNHTQQNFIHLDRISEQLNGQPDSICNHSQVKVEIAMVRQENENLKDIVTTFSYFEVKLEHEKMVSDPLQDTIEPRA